MSVIARRPLADEAIYVGPRLRLLRRVKVAARNDGWLLILLHRYDAITEL